MTGIKILDDKYAAVNTSNLPALVAWEMYEQFFPEPCLGSCIMCRAWVYLTDPKAYRKVRRKNGSTVLRFTVQDGEVL